MKSRTKKIPKSKVKLPKGVDDGGVELTHDMKGKPAWELHQVSVADSNMKGKRWLDQHKYRQLKGWRKKGEQWWVYDKKLPLGMHFKASEDTMNKYDALLEDLGDGDLEEDRVLEEGRRADEMALRKLAVPLAKLRMKNIANQRNPFGRLIDMLFRDENMLKQEMSNLDFATGELSKKIGAYGGIPEDKKFIQFFIGAALIELADEALRAGNNVLMDAVDDYVDKK